MMRMSDDAEFSSAADCPEQHHRKRAYVPYAKGMAEMELVQHVAKGGKFAPQDARIDRTPAQTIKSMAAFSRTEFPALEDKEAALHSRENYGKLANNRPTACTQIWNSKTLPLIALSTKPLRSLHCSRNTVHRPRQFKVV